jgi:hypothetical protein
MFAILAGLMTLLVVLGATINSRFDGGSFEKALVGLLAAPMLAFGNVKFSKGWLIGVASAALIGLLLLAGGLPLLFSGMFLGVACAAFWDRETTTIEVVEVEEYLDDSDLTRLIELGQRGLALQLADWLALGERGNLLALEDEREAARQRLIELEADNLRLVARLAQAYKPAAAELLKANIELQEIFGSLPLDAADLATPQWVREIACA